MTINKPEITCPICGEEGTWTTENVFKPFCSERCKLIDLGDWAAEKHRMAGESIAKNKLLDDKEED